MVVRKEVMRVPVVSPPPMVAWGGTRHTGATSGILVQGPLAKVGGPNGHLAVVVVVVGMVEVPQRQTPSETVTREVEAQATLQAV